MFVIICRQEEAVMVGITPQFPQEGAHFLNRATVGHVQTANHAPRAPQMVSSMVPQSPANSSMFQLWSRRCPANSRNVPYAGCAGPWVGLRKNTILNLGVLEVKKYKKYEEVQKVP
jgi:hypothetical protein